jgi:hypothetical protein
MNWRGWAGVVAVLLAARVAGATPQPDPVTAGAGDVAAPAAAVEPGACRIAPAEFAVMAEPSLLRPGSVAGLATASRPDGVTPATEAARHAASALGSARARILLRSLTLPGWGQATLGHRGSAVFFGLTETAVWGTFTAFRIQVAMREDAFLRTARLLAGIDLSGRDEEWRRIVGGYSSSDEYNQLVVVRDAANLYYDDPEAYRAYVAAHSLTGVDSWRWASAEAQTRYSSQRKMAQRAAQRANTVLAAAVVNRIVSALHAARVAGRAGAGAAPAEPKRSWRFEAVPGVGEDPLAFQLRVRAQF